MENLKLEKLKRIPELAEKAGSAAMRARKVAAGAGKLPKVPFNLNILKGFGSSMKGGTSGR